MRMNRRNVLAGIGALTAGGGAIFGSGAFSQVEAERTAEITVADDANGYLSIERGPGRPTDEADDIFINSNEGILEFYFNGSATAAGNVSTVPDANGLNNDAITYFDDFLTVTNDGTNGVTLTVTPIDGSGNEFDTSNGDPDPGFSVYTLDNSGNRVYDSITLSSNGDSADIGFEFDLVNGSASAYDGSAPSVASLVIDASTS